MTHSKTNAGLAESSSRRIRALGSRAMRQARQPAREPHAGSLKPSKAKLTYPSVLRHAQLSARTDALASRAESRKMSRRTCNDLQPRMVCTMCDHRGADARQRGKCPNVSACATAVQEPFMSISG